MQQPSRRWSWPRAVVLTWASLWMLAAPLFHVHPEADHRHGEAGHMHGGTVHTVWSPDLDCEFENHGDTVSGQAQFAHFSDGHTEFGLSLLTDSTDRKSLKPFLTQAFGSSPAVVPALDRCGLFQRHSDFVSPSQPFVQAGSSRAPPYCLLV